MDPRPYQYVPPAEFPKPHCGPKKQMALVVTLRALAKLRSGETLKMPVPPNYGSHYMQKLAHQYAQRMGFRVKTRVRAGELYLQRGCASGGRAKKGRAA